MFGLPEYSHDDAFHDADVWNVRVYSLKEGFGEEV
jgi:hypothetical protein